MNWPQNVLKDKIGLDQRVEFVLNCTVDSAEPSESVTNSFKIFDVTFLYFELSFNLFEPTFCHFQCPFFDNHLHNKSLFIQMNILFSKVQKPYVIADCQSEYDLVNVYQPSANDLAKWPRELTSFLPKSSLIEFSLDSSHVLVVYSKRNVIISIFEVWQTYRNKLNRT